MRWRGIDWLLSLWNIFAGNTVCVLWFTSLLPMQSAIEHIVRWMIDLSIVVDSPRARQRSLVTRFGALTSSESAVPDGSRTEKHPQHCPETRVLNQPLRIATVLRTNPHVRTTVPRATTRRTALTHVPRALGASRWASFGSEPWS